MHDWATSVVEQMLLEQRRNEQRLQDALGYNNKTLGEIVAQRHRFEEMADALTGRGAIEHVLGPQRCFEEFVVARSDVHAAALMMQHHTEAAILATQLAKTADIRNLADTLSATPMPEIWRRHELDVLSAVAGVRGDNALPGFQQILASHSKGVADLATALAPMMFEPASSEWREHLRTTALPAISFLSQEWTRPLGLLLDSGKGLGASITWTTRRSNELSVRVAAITTQAETEDTPRVSVEIDIVCMLCGGPLRWRDGLTWVGPRKRVLKREIFPLCPTCCNEENMPALLGTLRTLTQPPAPTLKLIRGRGEGHGMRRGDLRIISSVAPNVDPDGHD